MPVPDFQSFFTPLLDLASDGEEHSVREAREHSIGALNMSDEDLAELQPSGKRRVFDTRLARAKSYLVKQNLLTSSKRGHFKITEYGMELHAQDYDTINKQILKQYAHYHDMHRSLRTAIPADPMSAQWSDLVAGERNHWIDSAGNLCAQSNVLLHDATMLADKVRTSIDTGIFSQFVETANVIGQHFKDDYLSLDTLSSQVSMINDPVKLTANLLGDSQSLINMEPFESLIESSTTILDSTAAITNSFINQTATISHIAQSSIDAMVTAIPAGLSSAIPFDPPSVVPSDPSSVVPFDQSLPIPLDQSRLDVISAQSESLLGLADTLKSHVNVYGNLIETTLATSRLNAELFSLPEISRPTYWEGSILAVNELNTLANSVYKDYASIPSLDPEGFLFSAPSIEPYSAIRANSVVLGASDDILEQNEVSRSDSILDDLGDGLVSRLRALDTALADIYLEGIAAIQSGHHGWIRHASVSFREMFDHLLRKLATNEDLASFFSDPKPHIEDGKFKRSAQLKYIFREVAVGSYAKMAEKDIDIAQATFFPANEVVHRLETSLSDRQMMVFTRRIQGSLSVVLEAAGY